MNKETILASNNGILLETVIKSVVMNNITKKVKGIRTIGNDDAQVNNIIITFEDDEVVDLGIEYDANGEIAKIGDVVISCK